MVPFQFSYSLCFVFQNHAGYSNYRINQVGSFLKNFFLGGKWTAGLRSKALVYIYLLFREASGCHFRVRTWLKEGSAPVSLRHRPAHSDICRRLQKWRALKGSRDYRLYFMHVYGCKVVFCKCMVFCGNFGRYFCRHFADPRATALIALASGSGTCSFLLLLSAVLRASLCDDRCGNCSSLHSRSVHEVSTWMQSL